MTIRSLASTRAGGFRGEIRLAATGELATRPERGAGPPSRVANSPISLVSGRRFFTVRVWHGGGPGVRGPLVPGQLSLEQPD